MRFITALTTATLLLFLPACGDPEPEAEQDVVSAEEIVAGSPEATAAAGTAHFAMRMAAKGGPQKFEISAQGGIDYAKQRMSMVMKMPAMPGMPGLPKGADTTMEMVSDGTVFYMKLPNAKQLGLKTPWMKMDVSSLAGAPGGLGQFNNDPTNNMQMLRGVTEDVSEVGAEDIRGVPTTHYKATVDLKKALKLSPKASQKSMKVAFGKLGITELPTDIWIDKEGRVARQSFRMDMSKMEGGGAPGTPTAMDISIDLFDFGKAIDFKIPPKDQVTDMTGKLPGAKP